MSIDRKPVAQKEALQEYLTFRLGSEEYAVDILAVREIRGYDTVTRIPESPEFLKGVINLRGTIVPIVDLRIKFKLGDVVYNEFTVMIVLNVDNRTVGLVVDSVCDVIAMARSQIAPPPEFGSAFDTRYLSGLGTVDERMLIFIDIEKLLKSADLALYSADRASEAA